MNDPPPGLRCHSDQSGASIQVTWPVSTNQRSVLRLTCHMSYRPRVISRAPVSQTLFYDYCRVLSPIHIVFRRQDIMFQCLKAWYINKSFVGPNNPQLYQCKHSDQLSHSHAHYDTKWWHDDIVSLWHKVMTPPHRLLVSSNHCRRRKAQG